MKGGTIRMIPSQKMRGTLDVVAPTHIAGPRRERRRKENAAPVYLYYRGGWKSWRRSGAYWDRVRACRRIRNRMARHSRQINRRLVA